MNQVTNSATTNKNYSTIKNQARGGRVAVRAMEKDMAVHPAEHVLHRRGHIRKRSAIPHKLGIALVGTARSG